MDDAHAPSPETTTVWTATKIGDAHSQETATRARLANIAMKETTISIHVIMADPSNVTGAIVLDTRQNTVTVTHLPRGLAMMIVPSPVIYHMSLG